MADYSIEKRDHGFLLFTIKRAEKRNAINFAVMEGLIEGIRKAKDPDIKIFAITGEGEKAFCSGGDLSIFHQLRTSDEAYTVLSKMGNILYELMMLDKPTVAIMNGIALGGGCEIAAACDYRIGRKGMEAGFIQGKLAITTGWGGGTILAEKLPYGHAFQMLTEAKIYNWEELLKLSFLHYVYDGKPYQGCIDFLENILKVHVDVLKAYKEIWLQKWEHGQLKERIDREIRRCSYLWAQEAHLQEVDKFIARKK